MAARQPLPNAREAEELEGRIIIRRFTDELAGTNELERSTKAAQAEMDEEEEAEAHRKLRLLYETSANTSTSLLDFELAEIARSALQEMIDKYIEAEKPSVMQRIGISHRSARAKANEVLEDSLPRDIKALKELVDDLERKWKEENGPIYNAFKKLCSTLDDHKSVFAIFPSQNTYVSILCGSLSCLIKAAKTHSDIADTLSSSIVSISDKVARCSNLIVIIKTPRVRQLLANIYSLMFRFYRDAIAWYLQSKLSRAFHSFNEYLKKGFDDATHNIEDGINELYREAAIGSMAMIAMVNGKVGSLETEVRRQRQNYLEHDTTAGRRMIVLMEATWMDSKSPLGVRPRLALPTAELKPEIQDIKAAGVTLPRACQYAPAIEKFIIGDSGPAQFGAGRFWAAEEDVLHKLRAWMAEGASHTLWISSPPDPAGTTSAQAAALAVVAGAWQAETPLISHFCQRRQDRVPEGMSIEQVGLVGLVYSLIFQLLQFNGAGDDPLAVSEESFAALNGGKESWDASLEVLQALLVRTPVVMYCVIDGLNDLEWGDGGKWCRQFLKVLLARQQLAGRVFNLLLTTTGQSLTLPSIVGLNDRYISTRSARELVKVGRKIEL